MIADETGLDPGVRKHLFQPLLIVIKAHTLPETARPFSLNVHFGFETFLVHGESFSLDYIGGQVKRETVCIVKPEGNITRYDGLFLVFKGCNLGGEN